LAADILVEGDTVVVSADLSITGTNSPQVSLPSVKVVTRAPVVASVEAHKDDGLGVLPEVVYKPCSSSGPVNGAVVGTHASNSTVVASFQDCHEVCRNNECAAISFNATSNECQIFSTVVDFDYGATNIMSAIYQCWFHLQSVETGRYLSVDLNRSVLITRTEADSWSTSEEMLIHRASGLAVSIGDGTAGDPVVLVSANSTDPRQNTSFSPNLEFQISNVDSGYFFVESGGEVFLRDQAVTSPTNWTAEFGGERLVTEENGSIVTRLLTKSTYQDVSSRIFVNGAVQFRGTVNVDRIGELDVAEVADRYEYCPLTQTHKILTNLTLVSPVNVDNLYASSFHGRDWATFLADAMPATATDTITLAGRKRFNATVRFENPVTVTGLVSGHDIVAEHTATAFIDEPATFTKLNTFGKADENSTLTIEEELEVLQSLNLTEPQIEDGVNLVTMFEEVIPIVDGGVVTVSNKVIFTQDVTSGDIHIGELSEYPDQAGFLVPEDLILISETTISTNVSGSERTFSGITAPSLDIGGQILGHNPDAFLDILYKDGNQTITAGKNFLANVIGEGDIELESLNGIDPSENFIEPDLNTELHGEFEFTSITAQELNLYGPLDGFNFTTMYANIFTLDDIQTISEHWNISSESEFQVDIVGNGVAGDGLGRINNQKVSDLLAVKHIYDRVQAVKVSAQAEASTMCEFVEDLQDSYLANQGIRHLDKLAETSVEGSNFADIRLIVRGSDVFASVLDRDSLKFYKSSPDLQFETELALAYDEGRKFSSVLELDTTSRMLFLTSSTSHSTRMIRTGSGAPIAVEEAGELVGIDAVHIDRLTGDVFLLDLGNNRLSYLGADAFSACGTNCSDVVGSATVVWEDTPYTLTVGLEARMDMFEFGLNHVFAFTVGDADGIAGTVKILYVSSTYTPSNDDLVRSFTVENEFEVSARCDFSLLGLHDNLYLFSVDGVGVRANKLDVEAGSTEARHINLDDGSVLKHIRRQQNFLGDFNYFTVLKKNQVIVDLEYAGVDGLRTLRELDVKSEITSVDRIFVYVNEMEESFLGTVGGDRISLYKAKIHNSIRQLEFNCPNPEISPSLLSTTGDE